MKLLVVAAEERELRGILAHAHQRPVEKRLAGGSTCPTGINWARRAALGEYDLLLAANGAGPARAAVAVQRAAAVFQPDAIVSTGFCGALEDELGVASVVVATEVRGANGRFHARMPAASPPHCRGVVSTIDHVAQSAAEKPGEILIRVEACGICHTDLKKIEYNLLAPPRIYGHETAGVVARSARRHGFHSRRPRDRVPSHPCGMFLLPRKLYAQCPSIRSGRYGRIRARGRRICAVRARDGLDCRARRGENPPGVSFERAGFCRAGQYLSQGHWNSAIRSPKTWW
jgi:hypothetical protein